MKTSVLVFLTVCCLAFTTSAQTAPPQLSPTLQEAGKLNGEAVSLFNQKKFAEALPLAQKVVAIREKELGRNHLFVAQAYWNLAHIQAHLGKRKESENSFEKAFDGYENNQPLSAADEKSYVRLLEMIAFNQAVKGELDKSEKKFQRAVEVHEKIYGQDALETANSLSKLADLYQLKGDYKKAAPLLLRALDIKTQKTGMGSDDAKEVFQSFSCALTKLGREEELKDVENKYLPRKTQSELTPSIKAGVVNGKALNLIVPPYPAEAKEKRVSGTVNVNVLINETGNVITACAVTGARELHRASEIAAYGSKFTPTTVQGKPVRVTGTIVYNFVAR
jgi:TonB family protein